MAPLQDIGGVVLVAALIAAAIVMLLMAQLSHSRALRQLRGRISSVQARVAQSDDTIAATDVRLEQGGKYPGLEALARRVIPRPALLRQRLDQTGLKMGIGQYALICLGTGLAFTLIRALAFELPLTLSLLLGIVSGLGLPHIVVGILISRRVKKFLGDFPEAIDLIIRGLRSGLPVPESIRIVGQEIGGPVGTEFAHFRPGQVRRNPRRRAMGRRGTDQSARFQVFRGVPGCTARNRRQPRRDA